MTQEDKELLLKDLCARLPYGVKIHRKSVVPLTGFPEERDADLSLFDIEVLKSLDEDGDYGIIWDYDCKPYLRSMSEISNLISAKEYTQLGGIELIDWYNANHIDYRGLLDKGLAIEASKEMY